LSIHPNLSHQIQNTSQHARKDKPAKTVAEQVLGLFLWCVEKAILVASLKPQVTGSIC
jgi:hypothetical protein